MAAELWFKRKRFGWGWTPSNSKGWLVIIVFFLINGVYPMLLAKGYCRFSPGPFFLITGVSLILLLAICYKKGEKPSWNWDDKV
jgi:hypothetical protein